MPNDPNDISDVQNQITANTPSGSIKTLPVRGEKRILPVPINPDAMSNQFEQDYDASGQDSPEDEGYANTGRTKLVQYDDFYVHAAKAGLTDFVTIRILNRGQSASGNPDPTTNATYRFLINPATVQIGRSTLDAQAFARSGWQFGVWGEDVVQITLNGKTAGQYWAFGLTDRYQPYTQSFRNLEQLQVVFENNGYWFEGEQVAEGPLANDFARRRIKMQQDVELTVGNFIWYGMFESLEITQSAENPFIVDFTLSFIAWKERFRPSSPYKNQILSSIQRGNSYSNYAATQSNAPATGTTPATATQPPSGTPTGLAPQATPNVNPNTPSVTAAGDTINQPSACPTATDYTPLVVPGTNGASIISTPLSPTLPQIGKP
jgi:hypothetical protein